MNLPTKEIREGMKIINGDCMEVMKQYEDNYFDLAVVDPPYGINIAKEKPRKSGRWNYKPKTWDEYPPDRAYFDELARVSSVQIIWGGNYFLDILGNSRGMIYWYKHQPVDNFADGEIAWISKDCNSKCFNFPYYGGIQGNTKSDKRIHPTQKPIQLYNWIYKNYAQEGQKILDTHLGSGSNAISAHYAKMGEFVGVELDEDYYKSACERIKKETMQLELF